MGLARTAQILRDLADSSAVTGSDAPLRLVQACAAALPVSGVAVIMLTGKGPGAMIAATDDAAAVMEELQFTLGEGPCIEASTSGRPVLEADLLRIGGDRWPGFAAGALATGVRAIFALPLQVGAVRVGILDLYRDSPGRLGEEDLTEALAFADAAKVLLLNLQSSSDGLHSLLAGPVDDRAEVHQATGMVAVQAGVTILEALVLLRARAFSSERPVIDLAKDVVSRLLRFDPENGHHG